MVLPTDDLLNWIQKSNHHSELMSPVLLPMVENPSPWVDVYLGGYNSKQMYRRPLIKANSKSYYKEIEDIPMDKARFHP